MQPLTTILRRPAIMNKVFNNQQQLFEGADGIPSVSEQFLPTTLRVSQVEDKPVFVDFEGGALSSNAGALLLREVENNGVREFIIGIALIASRISAR